MEGRDIGSVVFPDADVKLFLEASPSERILRRARERPEDRILPDTLIERDRKDALVNPFVPAPGAVLLDTTGKGEDEVFAMARDIVQERLRGRTP
jgi:cytidylate kinase